MDCVKVNFMNNQHLQLAMSDDDKVLKRISVFISFLEANKIEYALVGSCGIQSYFSHFYRFPNDVDVVVRSASILEIKQLCTLEGYDCEELFGRLKINIKKLSIHIQPDMMNIVDEINDCIFDVIDLRHYFPKDKNNTLVLLNANSRLPVKVLSLEVNLYLELIRPIYTNSVITLFHIFKFQKLDLDVFNSIYSENVKFQPLITNRLQDYIDIIDRMSYYSRNEINEVKHCIKMLLNFLSDE